MQTPLDVLPRARTRRAIGDSATCLADYCTTEHAQLEDLLLPKIALMPLLFFSYFTTLPQTNALQGGPRPGHAAYDRNHIVYCVIQGGCATRLHAQQLERQCRYPTGTPAHSQKTHAADKDIHGARKSQLPNNRQRCTRKPQQQVITRQAARHHAACGSPVILHTQTGNHTRNVEVCGLCSGWWG